MTLYHILLFIYMVAMTLALVHAHRSGWPVDLWMNMTSRSLRDRRDDRDRNYPDHFDSSGMHRDI